MKRGIILLAFILLCAATAYAINVSSCSTLNSAGTYNLTANVSSTGTCMTIGASNIVLDCGPNTILWSTDGGSLEYGINIDGFDNITIQNCELRDPDVSATVARGIRINAADDITVKNSRIYTNGTSTAIAISIESFSQRTTILDNTLITSGPDDFNHGVWAAQLNHSRIWRNHINVSGNGVGADWTNGILLSSGGGMNNSVINNTIHTNGTAVNQRGIVISNIVDSSFIGNQISTIGDTGSIGIQVSGTPCNSLQISDNNVTTNAASSSAVIISSTCLNNTFTGNTMTALGSSSHGVASAGSSQTFVNSTITTQNSGVYAIQITGGTGTVFNDTVLLDPAQWLTVTAGNVTFYDLTFSENSQQISFENLTVNTTIDITKGNVFTNATHAFVNSTAIPLLNTSATITFTGTGFIGHRALVDFNDNGSFVECTPPLCTEVSDSPSVFVFDVLHFTTFSSEEFIPPVPEFSTIALFAILGLVLGGFIILRYR